MAKGAGLGEEVKDYVKLFGVFVGVWIFAWLAGSFAFASLSISEWTNDGRVMVAMLASFVCFLMIPAVLYK